MREDVKMSRCERRCEDEKMFYRPPLLEEPCAQTLSGKTQREKVKVDKTPGFCPTYFQSCEIWTCEISDMLV